MVLWRYEHGLEACYYDDAEEDLTWNLPPDIDYEPEMLDISRPSMRKKMEKMFTKVMSKRATALRGGLQAYEHKKYGEARRNFAMALRYGLKDEDIHYKDVHACLMVWEQKPTQEGLEDCRQAFQWLLQTVPSAQNGETLFELAKVYTCAGSYHLALELLNSMEVAFPASSVSSDGHMLAATILVFIGAAEQAAFLLEALDDEPPPGMPRDVLKLLNAWVEVMRGRKMVCLGYCEEGLRYYIQRMYEQNDPNKTKLGYATPFDWYKDVKVWVEAGDLAMARWSNYLLGRICYLEAVKRQDRSEATYLKLYDCQSHLGMSEEGLSWLSQGFLDNPLSMRMREILNDISDYWAHVFRVQAGAAIRIQAIVRRRLAILAKAEMIEQIQFAARQAHVWQLQPKWEMRRVFCSYFDRRKSKKRRYRVSKRDFFGAWRSALSELRREKNEAAQAITHLFHRRVARRRVVRQCQYLTRIEFFEHEVVKAAERYRKRKACRAFIKVAWLITLKPYVERIQCAYRAHLARKDRDKRKQVSRLFVKHCFRLEGMVFKAWRLWASDSRRDRMAVRIQSFARGSLARYRTRLLADLRRRQQVAFVRAFGRTWLDLFFSRWYNIVQNRIERQAVVRIQCLGRACLARRALRRLRGIRVGMARMAQRRRARRLRTCFFAVQQPWLDRRVHDTVTIIQCFVRCCQARQRVERRRVEAEERERRRLERERAEQLPHARRSLRAWRMVIRREKKARHAAATTLQRVFRGFRARRLYVSQRYWGRRSRLREKRITKLTAAAVRCGARVYTRVALKIWRRAFFVSRQATLIQCHFRGLSDRLYVAKLRERRKRLQAFLQRCMKAHDANAPRYIVAAWWAHVLRCRAALRIQACWRGFLGREEARSRRAERVMQLQQLHRVVLKNDRAWKGEGLARWRRFHHVSGKATKIQARFRGHMAYKRARKRRRVAETNASHYQAAGVARALAKMRANVVLQSCFRREKAYRRCRALAEAWYVHEEERAAVVAGRALMHRMRREFEVWRAEAADHRKRVIITQAMFRAKFAARIVNRRRARMAVIQEGMAKLAAKRGARWVRLCFKAVEGELVAAAVQKIRLHISLKTDPESQEVTSMADKMRRPSGKDASPMKPTQQPCAEPGSNNRGEGEAGAGALDLVPFLSQDGKLPLDLYPKAFVMARHQVRELGVLEWKRFQGLSFREKVWLLQAAPTLVVERASMHDLAEGLRCLAQHQQRSKLRKLVCLATRLPDRLGEFLDDLRTCTDLRGLCLTDVPLQLPEARALGCLLVEAQLEELVLERNHLCNAGLALICHAAQVHMSLLRLTVRGNVLDQPRAGHEAGDLLCNSGYLKHVVLSDCQMDEATLKALSSRAFDEASSQCRLDSLDLSHSPRLTHTALVHLLRRLGALATSLTQSGIGFINSVDLSACGVDDRVAEPLLDFLRAIALPATPSGNTRSNDSQARRFRIFLERNQLSELGARHLMAAADDFDVEVHLQGNDSLSMGFIEQACWGDGRTVTRHLERLVVADEIVQRPGSPFSKYWTAPPLLWA